MDELTENKKLKKKLEQIRALLNMNQVGEFEDETEEE